MTELRVAMDQSGDVWMFVAKPRRVGGNYYPSDENRALAYIDEDFAVVFGLRPGECKRLVLAEEVSE